MSLPMITRPSHARASSRRVSLSMLAGTALVLAACSGDDGDEAPVTATVTVTADASPVTDGPDTVGATANPLLGDTGDATEAPTDTPTDAGDRASTTAEPDRVTSAEGSFSIQLPSEWVDITEQFAEEGAAFAGHHPTPASGFYTNVVVITRPPFPDLEEALAASIVSFTDQGIEVDEVEPIEIDGVEAIGYTLIVSEDDLDTAQTQWWFEHDEILYIASVSAQVDEIEGADEDWAAVVDSWQWE